MGVRVTYPVQMDPSSPRIVYLVTAEHSVQVAAQESLRNLSASKCVNFVQTILQIKTTQNMKGLNQARIPKTPRIVTMNVRMTTPMCKATRFAMVELTT